jgi:hypothetical protein
MFYFQTKFEVDPMINTRKIKFLSVTWPNLDLDPYHLIWWLLAPRHSYMLTMIILRCKTKKFNFVGKIIFYAIMSPNDVITLNYFLIWKALIKGFYTRYNMIWLWWLICANLRFVVFSFCRGEKMTRRQNDNYRLFTLKKRQINKTTKWKVDKITVKRRQTQPAN